MASLHKNVPILAKVYKISQYGDFTAEGEFAIEPRANGSNPRFQTPDMASAQWLGVVRRVSSWRRSFDLLSRPERITDTDQCGAFDAPAFTSV
jgi:hypothetical protein